MIRWNDIESGQIHDFANVVLPIRPRVHVLGAGPSMNDYSDTGEFTITVNWGYQLFRSDMNVATHFKVVHHAWSTRDCPMLVYSRQTSDIGGMANNPPAPGIRFEADEDVWVGSSTIISAIHIASMISRNVYLFGVDLRRADETKMYCDGYRQESGAKPSNEHFDDWARVIERQVIGITRLTGVNLFWERRVK